MSSTYNGSAASFPASLTIPSDGDARTAASVNTPIEGLADRTAWLKAYVEGDGVQVDTRVTCTSSQTVTAPDNAIGAFLMGCGGGGGGAGGANPGALTQVAHGGGGGGGALLGQMLVPVVGGDDYSVAIGAGGSGGAATAAGSDGGNTTFTRVTGSVLVATFRGAQGGTAGAINTDGLGGGSVKTTRTARALGPQIGGDTADDGFPSHYGYDGGAKGAAGTNYPAGNEYGGLGGGGGGAGAFGTGANGGDGGDVDPTTGGVVNEAVAGSAAAANTGAGGGGGGGAPYGGANGGAGGNGGSGILYIVWVTKGAA